MTYLMTLLCALMLLTACSYESRQFWGHALQGAGQQVGSTKTTWCTTRVRDGVAYTTCY